jgi:hypothetical protein
LVGWGSGFSLFECLRLDKVIETEKFSSTETSIANSVSALERRGPHSTHMHTFATEGWAAK